MINGFLTFGMGSLIVAFHDVWTGLPAILTVLGWLYVLKSAIVFIAPQLGLKSMALGARRADKQFIVPGVFLVVMGLLVGYGAFTR